MIAPGADPQMVAGVDWVPGAYSIIRGAVLEQIGFFDPAFFLYYEEVDLYLRIQEAGICAVNYRGRWLAKSGSGHRFLRWKPPLTDCDR